MPGLGLKNTIGSTSVTGNPIVTRGATDYWVNFDGDDDTIGFSTSFNSYFGQKDFSLSAWIYHTGDSGTVFATGHISNGNMFRWSMLNDKPKFSFGQVGTSCTGTASSALNDSQWYHIGLTHDDSEETFKLYVDGSLTDEITSKDVPGVVHDTNAEIGTISETGSTSEITARIANLSIFSVLVTAGEMSNLASVHSYDATSIGNCVGWWRMGAGTEDGTGTTIYDMSTNSNNGTLSGASIQSGTIG
tara:strand:- start:2 stop:739 length:738 start_codon:yes stop_codon:yes gene_type:complete